MLALIPARGQSKGLPGKNIRLLHGKPMIQWTIEAARASAYIDRVIVSSDDPAIITAAVNAGCEAPFRRPIHLAEDDSSSSEVVLHALQQVPDFDLLVLLQPTSPLRGHSHIDQALELLLVTEAKSCVSVSEPHISPYWMYTLNGQRRMQPLLPGQQGSMQRQALPKTFALNGAIYVVYTNDFQTCPSFVGNDTVAYIMDRPSSIDIDYEEDFQRAHWLLGQRVSQD